MAKKKKEEKNNLKWLVGAVILFVVITGLNGDKDKKTGFSCSGSSSSTGTTGETCEWVSNEPDNLIDLEIELAKWPGGIDGYFITPEQDLRIIYDVSDVPTPFSDETFAAVMYEFYQENYLDVWGSIENVDIIIIYPEIKHSIYTKVYNLGEDGSLKPLTSLELPYVTQNSFYSKNKDYVVVLYGDILLHRYFDTFYSWECS